jgi:hypothetical protein
MRQVVTKSTIEKGRLEQSKSLVAWDRFYARFKTMILRICIFLSALVAWIAIAQAGPNCKCRFNGTMYKLGEIACIRGKLSMCELNLNNTSWKTVADVCPQVLLVPQKDPAMSIAPAKLARIVSD